MSQVVPLQPSVFEAAHNIAVMFAQADKARDKARGIRIDIGLELIDLKRRVDAGEARRAGEPEEFWVWIKLRNNRSLRDMRKCIALAKAENPEAASAKEREDARVRMKRIRTERANSSPPAQVVQFDPVERALDQFRSLIEGLSDDERKRFLVRAREMYSWLSADARQ